MFIACISYQIFLKNIFRIHFSLIALVYFHLDRWNLLFSTILKSYSKICCSLIVLVCFSIHNFILISLLCDWPGILDCQKHIFTFKIPQYWALAKRTCTVIHLHIYKHCEDQRHSIYLWNFKTPTLTFLYLNFLSCLIAPTWQRNQQAKLTVSKSSISEREQSI